MERKNDLANLVKEEKIQVEVYKNFEEINNLQPEWDSFMESIDAEIFLTFDWCRIWWKYYGKKRILGIFIFKEDNNICAILPLFWEKINIGPISLKVIKMVASDYMPVTISIPIKKDYFEKVIKIMLKKIKIVWQWDILYLGPISGKFPLIDKVKKSLEYELGRNYILEETSKDVQTYFKVEDSWESQVTSLGKNQRTNLRRTFRELSANSISICSTLASKENLMMYFNNFVQIHQNYWQRRGKPGHFIAWPNAYQFHYETAEIQLRLNRLRLIEIKFNEQIVGYEYIYKFNNTYYWFLSARADEKINPKLDYKWIAFREKIENAIKDKVQLIDGMRGKYEYKLLMGGKYFSIKNIFIYSKNSKNIKILILRTYAWFFDILYSKLWHGRIAPRFGIKRKVFWESWIRIHPFAF